MNSIRSEEELSLAVGLGCGGFSRLGFNSGIQAYENALALVRTAYDQGIRFFDTAECYETEPALGDGLAGRDRSGLMLCSKLIYRNPDGIMKSSEEIRSSLEQSLANLQTDYLDIYYIHAVSLDEYDQVTADILPLLNRFRKQGLIRKIGISEMFSLDTSHRMMERAVEDDHWDAVMVGFNMLNQSGREILKQAGDKGILRVNMFAVRQALINNEVFGTYMDKMIGEGLFRFTHSEFYEFKDHLFRGIDSVSFPGLAYQFVRDEALFDVILTGTGSREHLKDNLESLRGPELSDRIRFLIRTFFAGESQTSGQEGFF
jgi:L-galactose dehydrogenase